MTGNEAPTPLAAGTKIGEYVLESVLSAGNSSLTYMAIGPGSSQYVIKEYFPRRICRRVNHHIKVSTDLAEADYQEGLKLFYEVALKLSRLDSKNIPKIRETLSENNTAYIVMDHVEGAALNDILCQTSTLDEDDVQNHLLPILNGLDHLHKQKLLHLALCPQNIMIRSDGIPVLVGFASLNCGMRNDKEIGVVDPKYAPMEQHGDREDLIGPWTDIYALAAILYRCISGAPPEDSMKRYEVIQELRQDPLKMAVDVGHGKYSGRLLAAIDHGLEILPQDRPASINNWRQEFLALAERRETGGSSSKSSGCEEAAAGGNVQGKALFADYPDETEERFKLFRAWLGGKRQGYYMSQIHAQDACGLFPRLSWNWAGFMFSVFWACYRKMGLFVLLLGVPLLMSTVYLSCFLIENYIHYDGYYLINPVIDLAAASTVLLTAVGTGIFGNYFYYLYLRLRINRARKKFPDIKSQRKYLSRKGGTSAAAVVLSFMLLSIAGYYGYGYMERSYEAADKQIREGITVLGTVSSKALNFRNKNHRWPENYHEIYGDGPGNHRYISGVSVMQSLVVVTFKNQDVYPGLAGKSFALYGMEDETNGQVRWACGTIDVPLRFLPLRCRRKLK